MRSLKITTLFLSTCLLAAGGLVHAVADSGATSVEVFPTDVNLKYVRDKQTLVVRTTEASGVNRDVTAEAKFTLADPAKARIEKGVVYPVADGQTTLKVEYQGQSIEVPVKVEEVVASRNHWSQPNCEAS